MPQVAPGGGKAPISLVFLDTEGFESTGQSDAYDDRIFAFAAVIASTLIYNLAEAVRESDIEKLSFAVELANAFFPSSCGPSCTAACDSVASTFALIAASLIEVTCHLVKKYHVTQHKLYLLERSSGILNGTRAPTMVSSSAHVDIMLLCILCRSIDSKGATTGAVERALDPIHMVWVIQRDFLQGKSTQTAVDEALIAVPNPNHEAGIDQVLVLSMFFPW